MGGNAKTDDSIRKRYDSFVENVEDFRAIRDEDAEKSSGMLLSQDEIEVLYLHSFIEEGTSGCRPCNWAEWAATICLTYTIGGYGTGPRLHLEGLTILAEEEEAKPAVRRTIYPDTLSMRVRYVASMLGVIFLPILYWTFVFQVLVMWLDGRNATVS